MSKKKTPPTWERTALGALAGCVIGMLMVTLAYRGEDTVPVEVFVEHIETPAIIEIGSPATITRDDYKGEPARQVGGQTGKPFISAVTK